MDSEKKIIKIYSYYKDLNLPEECFNSKSLKNLLELSVANDINIFDDKKKLKNKKKIIKQCEDLKKIKLKEYTNELSSFNKKNNELKIIKIKEANENFMDKMESIDSIVSIINEESDDIKKLNNLLHSPEEFIDVFSN